MPAAAESSTAFAAPKPLPITKSVAVQNRANRSITAPFTPREMMLLFEERGRPSRPGTGNRAHGYGVHPDSPGQILLAPPDPGALRRGGVYWPSVDGIRQSSQTPYSSWGGDE